MAPEKPGAKAKPAVARKRSQESPDTPSQTSSLKSAPGPKSTPLRKSTAALKSTPARKSTPASTPALKSTPAPKPASSRVTAAKPAAKTPVTKTAATTLRKRSTRKSPTADDDDPDFMDVDSGEGGNEDDEEEEAEVGGVDEDLADLADNNRSDSTRPANRPTSENAAIPWYKMKHPEMLSADSQVIINNREHIALRIHNMEDLLRKLAGSGTSSTRRRRSSAASNTSASSKASAVSAQTQGEEEKNTVELIEDQFLDVIKDQHSQWIAETKKPKLTTRTANAKTHAQTFFLYLESVALPELYAEEWDDHPLSSLLPLLGDQTRIGLYVDMNKALVAREKEEAPPAEPRSAMKTASTNKRKKTGRVTTLSKDSQQTVKDTLSDPIDPLVSSEPEAEPDVEEASRPLKRTRQARSKLIISSSPDDQEDEGDTENVEVHSDEEEEEEEDQYDDQMDQGE